MKVSQDIVFEPHSPHLIDFDLQQNQQPLVSWNLPRTWAAFAPDSNLIADVYNPLDID